MNNQPNGSPRGSQPGEGAATGSLVVGILSIIATLVIGAFLPIGVILGIVGITLATSAKSKGFAGGTMTAGLVLSIISTALGGLYWVTCALCLGGLGGCGACFLLDMM